MIKPYIIKYIEKDGPTYKKIYTLSAQCPVCTFPFFCRRTSTNVTPPALVNKIDGTVPPRCNSCGACLAPSRYRWAWQKTYYQNIHKKRKKNSKLDIGEEEDCDDFADVHYD